MPIFLAIMSTAYSGARLALLATEGHKKLLSLTFWVFSYLWLGLVPLAQISLGAYPWPGFYDEWVTTYALGIVLIGFVAYDIGSWLGGRCYQKYAGRLAAYNLSLSRRRTYLLSLFAGVVALIAMQKIGGFDVVWGATRYALEQAEYQLNPRSSRLVWTTLMRVPPFVALLTMWWIWLNRGELLARPWQKFRHMAVFFPLLMLNLVVNNPIGLNRYYLGTILLSFLFISMVWSERRSVTVWAAGLVLGLMLIFPYADIFREMEQEVTFSSVTTQLTSNGDYDAFQQLENTVVVVSEHGITYGYQLLGAIFFWVPRPLWPDKPFGSGQIVAEHLRYEFTNLSSPLWAEAYINAGLIGVVAALLLFGLVTSFLQQIYIASTKRRGLIFIGGLVPILAAFQFFLLRGDLQNGIAYLTPMVGCYLLAARVTRVRPPP